MVLTMLSLWYPTLATTITTSNFKQLSWTADKYDLPDLASLCHDVAIEHAEEYPVEVFEWASCWCDKDLIVRTAATILADITIIDLMVQHLPSIPESSTYMPLTKPRDGQPGK